MDRSAQSTQLSALLRYLADKGSCGEKIPSLRLLSEEIGISQATVREQLEVARAIGLVEVRPKLGIRQLPYSFTPAVLQSAQFHLSQRPQEFKQFALLRKELEESFWEPAVSLLDPNDVEGLFELVDRAEEKINQQPAMIPQAEHRALHLGIFQKLGNPFVIGILEAYWVLYKEMGLDMFADPQYLREVWRYHRKMVEAIHKRDIPGGRKALVDHIELIRTRNSANAYPVD